ncbi:lytic transglycosylase domain-containing protein [Telmatobacter sp. DSM 110680]|uniref:Lytic transglycosylase domain-containing protein n=1 Tax=Telmatobacter sp. DSM 110680 TaxID=3036704 RepID=A0AAU7DEZ6_9BACT
MRFRLHLAAAALACTAVACPAFAAERVLLANGFDMRCNHHAQVGPMVRLYTGTGEASYIEFRPEEIAGYETVPDPPPSLAAPNSKSLRAETTLSPADLHQMLSEAGQQHNLDADLLASVVKAESNGNTRAVSRAGARGLMQLMPGTAAEQGVNDSFKADENVRGGSAYLNNLLIRYHDNIALALAAYNAGPAAVDKYHGIPPYHETRAYVARVIHEFNRRVTARQTQLRQAQTREVTFPLASLQSSPTR